MNILEINTVNFGSTGNIMLKIAENEIKEGHKVYICCPKSRSNQQKNIENQILIGNRIFRNLHIKCGYYTGYQGCFSFFSTLCFLRKIKKLNIDVIHLHNLHGCYINLPLLFSFIKKHDIKTIWTLHDCWAFTGQCTHFTIEKCDKWKDGCYKCTQYKRYPASAIDQTKRMWKIKKSCFTGVKDMTIITPSEWLSRLVKESFLKEYNVQVIHNGVDLQIFRPTKSKFREEYGLENKTIILGVAFGWDARKGLDVFIDLADKLSERYKIVLVGTDCKVDKELPDNIISIHRTNSQKELVEIYTAADVFVNPTQEENYPTVNMEAISCGTPVITFNTGGSPESVNEKTGVVTKDKSVNEIIKAIEILSQYKQEITYECLKYAPQFDQRIMLQQYDILFKRRLL